VDGFGEQIFNSKTAGARLQQRVDNVWRMLECCVKALYLPEAFSPNIKHIVNC
jgi:hypothetical protein